ncbi:hypothetical protein B0H13DRAFT_2393997, partial [Mycena leptocephala]
AYFDLDLAVLNRIVRSESVKRPSNSVSWVHPASDGGTISVDCSPFTTTVNGSPELGDVIRADVSLHRLDEYTGAVLTTSYLLIAHDIEPISIHYLRIWGVICGDGGQSEDDAGADLGLHALTIKT